ncbi:hypothetical protein NCLIV_033330 [Neospora caninum Liverpool]|uniref:Transmembrane protein n=1 Tax=Neospora caninum (strain Liverpool) TaxID=572307 RepID=F0VII5_NEOCL|nr:hypothetical protein NCLIV_033330 [Neospora caninum Liverpool]CBZ53546.1 hypothetical protein NCLIV_033330 [Neospora caninum Liverpool]|eukprot:XP_003883578.1 hypothetical protein NCLIV_033330 [Neospora caninum Liverpool]
MDVHSAVLLFFSPLIADPPSSVSGRLSPLISASRVCAACSRLQAGVYFDEEDRARKGQIYLWVSLTLVGLLVLVILYMLKIGSVSSLDAAPPKRSSAVLLASVFRRQDT